VERLDRYIDRMVEHVLATESFDLLMVYNPSPDAYLHASYITSPRQWAHSPGRALAAGEGLKRVARSIDRSVGNLWRTLDPRRDVLALVSDHGFVPLHDDVHINRVLADVGLVEIDEGSPKPRIAATSPMAAVPSGGMAHLYLNLRGRERSGVVEPAESAELLRRAARAAADLEVRGQPVVERIFSRSEARSIGLDHPASGDLIVFLEPGFAAGEGLTGEAITPSRSYGQHGYLAHHDALCGVFFARGAGVPHTRIKELPVTDVTPTVAGWLGLSFP
jgi:predicted AlkP superfamily phosphohydrolase/phosphomutase